MTRAQLILKRASDSRPSGEWSDDDYDSPVGSPWIWTYGFDPIVLKPAHGYATTREDAMATFAKSWRHE
jgi:hypothetical protein